MHDFKKLVVLEKAHALTLSVHKLTRSFPREEVYGLTAQMRRASSSIGMNLAEGCGRPSNIDYARFVHIALGSAKELEYQLLLARDLEYISHSEHGELDLAANEVQRMLVGLIRKLGGRKA